jgi:hypothetical protein
MRSSSSSSNEPLSETQPSSSNNDNENENQQQKNDLFECNICFDPANEPVITVCGHLFWYVNN